MTKKIIMAVLSVVAVFAALGTTTFAWLTMDKVAKVDQLDLNVKTGEGVEISIDGSKWSSVLSKDDINAWLNNAAESGRTTAKNLNQLVLDAVTPSATYANPVTDYSTPGSEVAPFKYLDGKAATDEAFLSIPVYFRVKGTVDDTTSIAVQWIQDNVNSTPLDVLASTKNSGAGVTWKADRDVTSELSKVGTPDLLTGTYYNAKAANAARVSVGDYVYQNPVKAFSAGGDAVGTAVAYGNTVLTDGTVKATSDKTTVAGQVLALSWGSHDYYNQKKASSLTAAMVTAASTGAASIGTLMGTNTKWVTSLVKDNNDTNDTTAYVWTADDTLTATDGWYQMAAPISLNVWLEGWDFECLDAIYSDILQVNLFFVAKSITA